VRIHGAGHGDSARLIGETVVGFILDRLTGFLGSHAGLKATTLDHETVNHTVKNHAVVKAITHILFKIGCGIRRLLVVQFQCNVAEIGLQDDHVHQSQAEQFYPSDH